MKKFLPLLIFVAVILGVACIAVGEVGRPVVRFFHSANAIILLITRWIMALSPVAIFCLMAGIVATHGLEVFRSLGWYCGTRNLGVSKKVADFTLPVGAVVVNRLGGSRLNAAP